MGVQINGDTGNISATKADYSGNVTIGGTLTYEDVTNIDSVGLITARNGIEVGARPGVGASISVDGNAEFAGIVTATQFKGDGSNLTGLSGVSVANQSDNRLITATGTTDALNAESGAIITADSELVVGMTAAGGAAEDARLQVRGDTYAKAKIQVLGTHNDDNPVGVTLAKSRGSGNTILGDNDDIGQIDFAGNDGNGFHNVGRIMVSSDGSGNGNDDLPSMMRFFTTSNGGVSLTERMRIDSNGNVTKPTNFHLLVNLSQNYTVQNASTTNTDLVKWDRVITAQSSTGASSYFNTSTHLFTAPVDGIYLFHIAVNCDFNVEGAWLVIDGSRANYTAVAPPSQNTSSVSLTHKLTASQTVGVKWYDAGNTNADFFSNDLHTWWKITLLG